MSPKSDNCWQLSAPKDKTQSIADRADEMAKAGKADVRELQSLLGKLVWVTSLWPPHRAELRPLFATLAMRLFSIVQHNLQAGTIARCSTSVR
jgi:hypothetical protein